MSARRALDSGSTNTHISHFQFAVVILLHSSTEIRQLSRWKGREGWTKRKRVIAHTGVCFAEVAKDKSAALTRIITADASPGIHLIHVSYRFIGDSGRVWIHNITLFARLSSREARYKRIIKGTFLARVAKMICAFVFDMHWSYNAGWFNGTKISLIC